MDNGTVPRPRTSYGSFASSTQTSRVPLSEDEATSETVSSDSTCTCVCTCIHVHASNGLDFSH